MSSEKKYNRAKEKRLAKQMADPISEIVLRSTGVLRQSPFIPAIEGDEEEEEAMEIIRDGYFED